MRTRVLSVIVSVLASSVAVLLGSGAALAAEPIKPGQHFVGIVNGVPGSPRTVPVVYTVCAGPAAGTERTGSVAGGQTVAVARVARGSGYTGVFSSVNVWFVQDVSAGGAPQQLTLTSYGTKLDIPTTVQVPCDGTGQVEFSSCPRFAPCAFGWLPILVTVRFVNVAD
jgi:hypothetical protein